MSGLDPKFDKLNQWFWYLQAVVFIIMIVLVNINKWVF